MNNLCRILYIIFHGTMIPAIQTPRITHQPWDWYHDTNCGEIHYDNFGINKDSFRRYCCLDSKNFDSFE